MFCHTMQDSSSSASWRGYHPNQADRNPTWIAPALAASIGVDRCCRRTIELAYDQQYQDESFNFDMYITRCRGIGGSFLINSANPPQTIKSCRWKHDSSEFSPSALENSLLVNLCSSQHFFVQFSNMRSVLLFTVIASSLLAVFPLPMDISNQALTAGPSNQLHVNVYYWVIIVIL